MEGFASANDTQRLNLEVGTIFATMSAPPNLFVVDTPGGTAFDQGCAYHLMSYPDGTGGIHVTHGSVNLNGSEGRVSYVPAHWKCNTRRGIGPGTPYHEDSNTEFQNALYDFDFNNGGAESVRAMITVSGAMDGYTLLTILPRVDEPLRRQIVDRLMRVSPPPQKVDPASVWHGLDGDQINAWQKDMISDKKPGLPPGK